MSKRITQLDTIRGVAVMGILIMNGVSYGLGNVAYFDIGATGTSSALDLGLGVLGEVFADQKFMGLFSLLFGASMLLFLDRVQKRTERPVGLSLWRNFLLFAIGVAHATLWVGDVLIVYGMCAPVLLMLRKLSAKWLIGFGVGCFSLAVVSNTVMGIYADDAMIRAVWQEQVTSPEAELAGLAIMVDVFSRALGMMLVGMGMYRGGWLTKEVSKRNMQTALVVIGLAAVVTGAGVWWVVQQEYDAQSILQGNVLNGFMTIPMTLGYVTVLMWFDQVASGKWLERVRSLGKMALTNYLGQTVICLSLMLVVPVDWVSRSTIWLVILAVWLLQLIGSERWLRRFRMGPLEWLWRCATYLRVEPLNRR